MSEPDQIFAKCARRLIPFIAVLYFVNYVDRVNVSFAALTMNRDLAFSPSIYGLGAGIFFWGYLLFQIPANAVLVRVGARRWIFSIMAVWGAISAANAFVRSPETFYALRFLLGVAEAGFFPGMVLYLTYWFPQAYRARFIAGFMVAIPLAFVIGGPLSGVILRMDGALSPGIFARWAGQCLVAERRGEECDFHQPCRGLCLARSEILAGIVRSAGSGAGIDLFRGQFRQIWRRIVVAADCTGDGRFQFGNGLRGGAALCTGHGCNDLLGPLK